MKTGLYDNPNVSLEALAGLQVPRDISISPDGTKVAYVLQEYSKKGEHFTSSIWIANVGEANSSHQLTSGSFNDEQPLWSPAGTKIAFKSDRHQPGTLSAIYLLSPDGGEPYPITPVGLEKSIAAFQWDSTGTSIAFTSADEKTSEQVAREKRKNDPNIWGQGLEYYHLRIVDIERMQVETIFDDNRHIHDFTWSPDSRELCLVLQKSPDINCPSISGQEVWRISKFGKEQKRLVEFPGLISQIEWGDSGVYFIAGHVPNRLFTSLSLYGLDLKRCSYSEKRIDAEHCCITIRKNQSCMSYRVQRYLADEFYWINDGTLTKIYGENCEMISFDFIKTRNNAALVVTKGDGSNPEEVFSISESGRKVKLSDHNSSVAAMKISKSWSISFRAADGYDVDGMIYVPSTYNPEGGPLPTILIPHGGPYWRITTGFAVCHCLEAPVLVSMGYAVLCPNYRGGSSRGERHATYSHGRAGKFDYTDCIDVLRYCIDRGWVDPDRVVIGGWSQGGFLSYLAVTRTEFKFRGAICGAGVSDWAAMMMMSDAYMMQAEMVDGAPWDIEMSRQSEKDLKDDENRPVDKADIHDASALWHMRDVVTPILILHGENDVRVPVAQAIAFYRACIHHKVPVEMVTYPREGHFITEREHLIDMWARMREFCHLLL